MKCAVCGETGEFTYMGSRFIETRDGKSQCFTCIVQHQDRYAAKRRERIKERHRAANNDRR